MAKSALEHLRSTENLKEVWKAYRSSHKKSAPGIDGITLQHFDGSLMHRLKLIRAEIGEGYSFSSLRAIPIPKRNSDKKRLICIPTLDDRVVQRAVLKKIEQRAVQLRIVNEVSFGFVKGETKDAKGLHAARKSAVALRQANRWAFKADISAFFDSIERQDLIERFDAAFKLRSLRQLVRAAIACEVDDHDPIVRRILVENGIKKGTGLRQGMPLSPILSNFVLRDFDDAFSQRSYKLIRYADDFVVFAQSEDECKRIQDFAAAELDKLGLSLSKSKTDVYSPTEPVEFLGMDLALRLGSEKFCLVVSNQKMDEIKKNFRRYHDWSIAQNEGLNAGALFTKLNQMRDGYGTAYSAADNITDLNNLLDELVRTCSDSIYGSLFGRSSVGKLNTNQRAFLMMPSK